MSELLDEKSLMNEKRGSTLKVISILSWIYIGLSMLATLPGVFSGPLTPEELELVKVELLEASTPETEEVFGEGFIQENISMLERSNEYHYSIMGLNISGLILGFYAVFLMYNLKKNGFYLYIVYSFIPVLSQLIFFESGTMRNIAIGFWIFIAALFILLYGLQLKRMS